MFKRKHDIVSPEMRNRLQANRNGRLTTDQWLSIVTKPLLWLVLLIGLAVIVFGPRMMLLSARYWWLGLTLIVLLFVVPLVLRARRYARLPIHFARLYSGMTALPFQRTTTLFTAADEAVPFRKRMTPMLRLRNDGEYLVYYLVDSSDRVLLSLAPADHADADQFLPTDSFKLRFNKRAQS